MLYSLFSGWHELIAAACMNYNFGEMEETTYSRLDMEFKKKLGSSCKTLQDTRHKLDALSNDEEY